MEDYTGGGKKERTVIPFSLHQAKKNTRKPTSIIRIQRRNILAKRKVSEGQKQYLTAQLPL